MLLPHTRGFICLFSAKKYFHQVPGVVLSLSTFADKRHSSFQLLHSQDSTGSASGLQNTQTLGASVEDSDSIETVGRPFPEEIVHSIFMTGHLTTIFFRSGVGKERRLVSVSPSDAEGCLRRQPKVLDNASATLFRGPSLYLMLRFSSLSSEAHRA